MQLNQSCNPSNMLFMLLAVECHGRTLLYINSAVTQQQQTFVNSCAPLTYPLFSYFAVFAFSVCMP